MASRNNASIYFFVDGRSFFADLHNSCSKRFARREANSCNKYKSPTYNF